MRAMRISQAKSWKCAHGLFCLLLLLGFVAQPVFSTDPNEKDLMQKSGPVSQENKQNILLTAEHPHHRRIKDADKKNVTKGDNAPKPKGKKKPSKTQVEEATTDMEPDAITNSTRSAGEPANPSDPPVKVPEVTSAPVVALLSTNNTDTPAPAVSTSDAAAAPVATPTNSPVKIQAPTSAPVALPAKTRAPTKSPIVTPADPTDSPVEPPEDECGQTQSCDSCQALAETLGDDEGYTCWWNESKEKCETVDRSEHDEGEKMCDTANTEPQGKPTQPPSKQTRPASKPTSPPIDWDGEEGDGEGYFTLILGFAAVLGVLFILVRKFCSRQIMPSGSVIGGHSQGKYQGVSLSDAEDDEEWGWDDTPQQSSVEMSNVRSPQVTSSQSLHFRNSSPRNSGVGSFDSNAGLPVSKTTASQPARKGLSVKRAGMKNPMKQSKPQAVPASHRLQPPAPIVRKTVEKIPTTDDFFEEMGFTTPTPKSGASTTTGKPAAAATTKSTGLGAMALSVGAEDLSGAGGDEWEDDADLDDLLDD